MQILKPQPKRQDIRSRDAILTELRELRKLIKGISPKLELWKTLGNRQHKLLCKLNQLEKEDGRTIISKFYFKKRPHVGKNRSTPSN